MIDKLSLYDVFSALIPGTLLVASVAILFPGIASTFSSRLPNEFIVVALLGASLVAGLFAQTLGSLIEPFIFKVFGGGPSDRALAGTLGSRYLPTDAAVRIKTKLRSRFGAEATDHSLFLGAMVEAQASEKSRAATFNAQYGYLRSIVVLLLMLVALLALSRCLGTAHEWRRSVFWTTIAGAMALSALFTWRTWQRGVYYAREVLLSAERLLKGSAEAGKGSGEKVD
jgi:hypothetical protein